jgi:hypothetical protein
MVPPPDLSKHLGALTAHYGRTVMPLLNEKHRADLHASSLTDQTIDAAGFYTVDTPDTYRRLANLPANAPA